MTHSPSDSLFNIQTIQILSNSMQYFSSENTIADEKLPVLTLYTKHPCQLCDELVEELNETFHGRFELSTVNIAQKENLKYLRLYRNDIPVLHLNGQFLCMHRLNAQLLERKLRELKEK